MNRHGTDLPAAPVHTGLARTPDIFRGKEKVMSETPQLPVAAPGNRFVPGRSGNPKGRPTGSRNNASLAIEKLLAGEAEALARKAIEKALDGDSISLRLCLDRLAPRRRDRLITFALPEIATAEDAERAGAAVLSAMAAGLLTPREGGFLMTALVAQTNLIEAGSVERRLVAVEATVRR